MSNGGLAQYVRQFGRFQRNARLYLISNALSGVTTGIFLVLYNLYLVSLGYGPDFIGVVYFVAAIGAGIAIFPAGLCVDRYSGKAILIWSSVLIGVAGVGQILFRQPASLLVSGFIAGVGAAFQLVVNAPFLTRNSALDERPHLFSVNIVLGLATIVVGKVLGGALPIWFRASTPLMGTLPSWLSILLASQPQARAYQFALLFAGIVAGPSFIPLFFMSNDRPRSVTQNANPVGAGLPRPPTPHASSTPDLSRSLTPNSPVGADLSRPRWSFASVMQWFDSIHGGRGRGKPVPTVRIIIRSPIFLLTLVEVLIGGGAGLFVPYANLFFVQHLGASSAFFGLVDGATTTITALMTLVAPLLAARIGRLNGIVLTELASIPLLIALGLTPLVPLVAIFYLCRQPLMDMSNGVLQVFSMEAAPRQFRGIANSSYQAGFQVANAITATLGGFIITQFGYSPLFIGAAVCYVLAIGTLWGRFGRGYDPLPTSKTE